MCALHECLYLCAGAYVYVLCVSNVCMCNFVILCVYYACTCVCVHVCMSQVYVHVYMCDMMCMWEWPLHFQAAGHVHRYLTLDESILLDTTTDLMKGERERERERERENR